jgi:hypothetical protein
MPSRRSSGGQRNAAPVADSVAACVGDGAGEGVQGALGGGLRTAHGLPALGATDDLRLLRLLGGEPEGEEPAAQLTAGGLGPLFDVVEGLP